MTRRAPSPRTTRASRDPYGLGPAAAYAGPAVAAIALVVIASLTWGLMNGELPFRGGNGGSGGPGPIRTPAPSNVVIPEPEVTFPGSIVYAKAGNIWIQTTDDVRQLTSAGVDSMPSFSADGEWVYFIRETSGRGLFPVGGRRNWYDLATPELARIHPDGTGLEGIINGRFRSDSNTWFFWMRQPVPAPDGRSLALISDGPNPTQSDVVLQTLDLETRTLTRLDVDQSSPLGHQDPAWRSDGIILLYVRNGREGTRGAPQIYRYDTRNGRSAPVTGPGYLAPAYSPDGTTIAATKTDAFGTDIVILDATTGTELLRVTDDDHSFGPVWSPAGDAVAFLHLDGQLVDLRMATLDRAGGRWSLTETVPLTNVSGLDGGSRPSWFVPPDELPDPTPSPSPSGSPAGSGSGSGSGAASPAP